MTDRMNRYKNPLHHYNTTTSVGQYLAPSNGYRGEQLKKGIQPRDHQKDFRLALKEMQAVAKQRRAEEDAPKPEVWKMSRFKNVNSKVKQMMEDAPSTADNRAASAPSPQQSTGTSFLRRGTLNKRVNEKAAEARAKVMSPRGSSASSPRGSEGSLSGVTSPRYSETGDQRKPSVPRHDELAKLAPRTNKNHILENRRQAAILHPPLPKEDQGPYRHTSQGEIPGYLQERKQEWADEEARKKAALPDPNCPAGMRLLSEEQRQEMLRSLDETEAEVRRMLVRIPLQVDTISMTRKREGLERRLGEIARNRMLFSKQKVFIKADEEGKNSL